MTRRSPKSWRTEKFLVEVPILAESLSAKDVRFALERFLDGREFTRQLTQYYVTARPPIMVGRVRVKSLAKVMAQKEKQYD